MRWRDDGGDHVDDDPDDSWCDGNDDDDGDDSHLREGISPADFCLPESFFSLSGFRLMVAAEK